MKASNQATKSPTRVVPNAVLLPEVEHCLRQGQPVRLIVTGKSMRPFLRHGDHVLLHPINAHTPPPIGSLLLCKQGTTYLLHRLVARDTDSLLLRGDGNLHQTECISPEDVLGQVSTAYRGKHSIAYNSLLWKCFYYGWPTHPDLRRLGLKAYRKYEKLRQKHLGGR